MNEYNYCGGAVSLIIIWGTKGLMCNPTLKISVEKLLYYIFPFKNKLELDIIFFSRNSNIFFYIIVLKYKKISNNTMR